MASEPTLSSLAALAASSSAVDDDAFSADPSSSTGTTKTKEQLRRHYVQALHKVIDESDVVMLVLDARDPEGCRSRLVEEEVRRRESEGKKLVFVLTKTGEDMSFFSKFPTNLFLLRSGPETQRPSMAQIPPTHNTHPSLPLTLLLPTPTYQHLLHHRSSSPPTPQRIQTQSGHNHHRCRRLSQCREE